MQDQIENPVVRHLFDFTVKVHAVNHIVHIFRKTLQILDEVVFEVVGIGQQLGKVILRGIVEFVSCQCFERIFFIFRVSRFQFLVFFHDRLFGRGEGIFETFDDTERENDVAVFVWLVDPDEFVGNRPDEVRFFLNIGSGLLLQLKSCHREKFDDTEEKDRKSLRNRSTAAGNLRLKCAVFLH